MEPVTLVDTDVLIAHLRGLPAARAWLHRTADAGGLMTSVVTVAELTGGMRSAERRQVWTLLGAIPSLPVTDAIARRAGELRRTFGRSHSGIDTTDYLIAATAIEHGLALATLKVRHFPMLPALRAPFVIG